MRAPARNQRDFRRIRYGGQLPTDTHSFNLENIVGKD